MPSDAYQRRAQLGQTSPPPSPSAPPRVLILPESRVHSSRTYVVAAVAFSFLFVFFNRDVFYEHKWSRNGARQPKSAGWVNTGTGTARGIPSPAIKNRIARDADLKIMQDLITAAEEEMMPTWDEETKAGYNKYKHAFETNLQVPPSYRLHGRETLQGAELAKEQVLLNLETIKWRETNDGKPFPARPMLSAYDNCPPENKITTLITTRIEKNWHGKKSKSYLEENAVWQNNINDKLGGFIFATLLGVPTPKMLFCTAQGPDGLDGWNPWHVTKGFVIKDTAGFSSIGTFVLPSGFGGVELLTRKKMNKYAVKRKLAKRDAKVIYAEELVLAEDGDLSVDYKFYMYGGRIGTVGMVLNRGSERECMRWSDEDWNLRDEHACFMRQKKFKRAQKYHSCNANIDPPKQWEELKRVAKFLGSRIGVFMRVDLLIDQNGVVNLGEFTPWPMSGKYHCDAGYTDGKFDACLQGREWDMGQLKSEGGDNAPEPWWVQKYRAMSYQEQCEFAIDIAQGKVKDTDKDKA